MKSRNLIRPPESRSMKGGRVFLMPGEEVGEHVTEGREEIIIVLGGEATVITEDRSFKVGSGETRYIGEGTKHNVKNLSGKPLEYVYVVSLLENR
jgi:quercetin dioxygenase-like cupin family protein